MVYRKTRAAAMALSVALAVALASSARAASTDPLAVVQTSELDRSVSWSELLPVRADLGHGRLLVEMDAAAWRATHELHLTVQIVEPQGVPGEILYRVVGPTAVERAMMPRMGRVLWNDGEQVLLAPSHEEDVWALGGDGVKLARVSDHAMLPPRISAPRLDAAPAAATGADPVIADIVSKITGADIQAFDQDLVNFGTRYANLQGGVDTQNYLVTKFQSFGLTQIEQQAVSNVMAKNVCATLPGTTHPENVLVVGGHFDSITSNHAVAPGADDDGSGTSAMIDIASVMSKHHFQSSITFCGFTGEELGVLGSAAYAAELSGKGTNVVGAIALDMIGYLAPGDAMDIDVLSNTGSTTLRNAFANAVATYEPSAAQVDGQIPQGASSDHASFWQEGYPALLLFEDTDQYTPYLHTANDTIGTSFNSPTLAEETARGAAALLATLAVPNDATGTPTPTPNPTGTPGANPGGMSTVHGSCMCEVADGSVATALAPALLALASLAAAARRRRRA